MNGFAMTASKPIFMRWSSATWFVFSMSFNLMSAIDCRPCECASLFICDISLADSGRIRWKLIFIAQTCCSTALMVFAAKSCRPGLPDGGSSARTILLFLWSAALSILSEKLVIGLYQRVILCQPYHLEVDIAVLVKPRRKQRLLHLYARVAQEWLCPVLVKQRIVKVRCRVVVVCAHWRAKNYLVSMFEHKERQRRLVKHCLVGGHLCKAWQVVELDYGVA